MSTTSNDQSSDSTVSSPIPSYTIKNGSLSLANFIQQLENTSGRQVQAMTTVFRRRTIFIPVQLPQANNADRFYGHGNQIVEDVAYSLAGRQRLSTHGILEFNVRFDDYGDTEVVYYHF
uniref:Uncharacterized protein n=1 Tax=Acrobeloides nanus TaxID=290746 RepID=A0A914E7A3_9BILA